ncbi:hypothetical protein KL935_003175 [Ogataea polymorpha]|nr:hypothetical protein KL936_003446 [Ogataea polymorpha]KAG7892586.1 hypothetical protein KL908_003538 [Ogataea polymorpha]KAG7900432.1 hypothetical protein KL935_003175 [Ogataea polymorpha]KAG7909361.1 hypothetical protein KL906_002855 [Ogataea polymorpha]KAG7915905.1 hypothetical protein KL927_003370 [Ogataea polymorpha]
MSSVTPQARKHVNMMVDSTIRNLEKEDLQAILRNILSMHPSLTETFKLEATKRLKGFKDMESVTLFEKKVGSSEYQLKEDAFEKYEKRIRGLIGIGLAPVALDKLHNIVEQVCGITYDEETETGEIIVDKLAIIDGDIVQTVTGLKEMGDQQDDVYSVANKLLAVLKVCKSTFEEKNSECEFPFDRGEKVLVDYCAAHD